MSSEVFTDIIVAVVASGALFGFIQFLITRKDTRGQDIKDIKSDISEVKADVKGLNSRLNQLDQDRIEGRLEDHAIESRIRILTASDEMQHHVKHSKEFFDQLNEDITNYTAYCDAHPNFKNNKALHAINYINEVYAEALKQNDFL